MNNTLQKVVILFWEQLTFIATNKTIIGGKRIFYVCMVLFYIIAIHQELFAQISNDHQLTLRLSEVALLDIEPGITSVSLDAALPVDAGEPLEMTIDNSSWINYTSCVSNSSSRTISVELDGILPSWLELQLDISSYSGSGQGNFGTSVGTITLSGVTTNIITGITRCYTGDGINNGHQLTYRLVINDYASLVSTSYGPLLVTYTISN